MSWMPQNVTQNFGDMLYQSLEPSSILLIIITAVVGVVSFAIKTISEPYLKQLKHEKKTRKAEKRYSYALLKSAYTLRKDIDNLLSNYHSPMDDNILLEKLYNFGCFFAWCKILENDSFLEYSQQGAAKLSREDIDNPRGHKISIHLNLNWLSKFGIKINRYGITLPLGISFSFEILNYIVRQYPRTKILMKIGKFTFHWTLPRITRGQCLNIYLSNIYRALSDPDYFDYDEEPRYPSTEMFKRSIVDKTINYDLISFTKFVQSFSSEEFRKWFPYVKRVLSGNSISLERLHILNLYLKLFYIFLDSSLEDEEGIISAFDHLRCNINQHTYDKVRKDLEDIYELTGSDFVKKFDKTSLTGLIGAPVYAKDKRKIGNIEGVKRSFIAVKGGIFYIYRYYIPVALIDRCEDVRIHLYITEEQRIHLNITEEQAKRDFIREFEPDRRFYYTNDLRVYHMQYGNPSFARSFPPVPVNNQTDNNEMRQPSAKSYKCELCESPFDLFETEDRLDNHVKIQHVNPMDLNEKNLNALM